MRPPLRFSLRLKHYLCPSLNKADESKKGSNGGSGNGGNSSGKGGRSKSGRKDSSSNGSQEGMVVVKPEEKFRDVLVIELNRRPLMPGTAMPVVVNNPKLVEDLTELKKAGCASLERPQHSHCCAFI